MGLNYPRTNVRLNFLNFLKPVQMMIKNRKTIFKKICPDKFLGTDKFYEKLLFHDFLHVPVCQNNWQKHASANNRNQGPCWKLATDSFKNHPRGQNIFFPWKGLNFGSESKKNQSNLINTWVRGFFYFSFSLKIAQISHCIFHSWNVTTIKKKINLKIRLWCALRNSSQFCLVKTRIVQLAQEKTEWPRTGST